MQKDEKTGKVPIFNPLNKDIRVVFDSQGPNPRSWTLKAKEATYVESLFANHVKKHLADSIFDAKGDYRKDREMQMKDIYKQMEI